MKTMLEIMVYLHDLLLVQLKHDPLWNYMVALVLSGGPCCFPSIQTSIIVCVHEMLRTICKFMHRLQTSVEWPPGLQEYFFPTDPHKMMLDKPGLRW